MDKRKNPRFESHLEAKLIATDGSSHACHVADFSLEGLRVYWSEEEKFILKSKDILQLYLTLENVPLNISVECLYQEGSSAGFKLHQPTNELVLQLHSINQANRNHGALSNEKRSHYKKLFQQRVKESSHGIIKQWHSEFLDELFNRANKAHNNSEQQVLFNAKKLVKEQGSKIQTVFLTAIAKQLTCWLDGLPSITDEKDLQKNSSGQYLSLIQQDDFEDWLLAKVASTHLQSRLSHTSFEVRQLLDIISEAPTENCFNPLSTDVVTEAFRGAIEPLKFEKNIRQIAFEIFQQVAGQQLQSVYQWLIKNIDIPLAFRNRRNSANSAADNEVRLKPEPKTLPASHNGLQNKEQKQQDQSPTSAYQSPSHAQTNLGSIQSFHQHQLEAQQAYNNIQSLVALRYQHIESGLTRAHEASELSQPIIPIASHDQVHSALQQLWGNANTQPGQVRQDLEQALAAQDLGLPVENREAIDTLEHVTRNLVASEQISDFVKPFIAQLEQPLSMMMLSDPSIMFNSLHPGRVTLNSISKLGRMTTTGQDRVSEKLAAMLRNIDTNNSAEPLEKQLQSLQLGVDTMLVEAERRAKMNADRVAQAAEGEHRVDQAREKIDLLITRDTAGRTLPTVVMEWLEQGWKPLLTLIYLRETLTSKRFRGAVKLYRQVLSLFGPKNSGRKELLARFYPLIKLMHHELDQLNGARPEHTRWHNEINLAAEQHLERGEIEEVVEVPTEIKDKKPTLEGKGVRRALNLQVGDWLLMVESDQNISVVWMAEDGSKLACVNHSGMKVIDFTLERLAAAFDDGSVKRLYEQEESAVEQSLDALIQQIYNDLSAQANTDALTQINTRQHFMRHLKEETAKSHRSNLTHTLCMIDIDQFKLINSEYGVGGGDECLKKIASVLLKTSTNKNDCARMGSNEFAILFQHSDLSHGEAQAHILKQTLEKLDIISAKHKFRIRLSMGVAELNNQICDEIDPVVFAESACLSAKEKGGSRVYRYIEDDHARIKRGEFMSWANTLNQALETDQLQLLCLPVTAIQENEKQQRQYEVIISIKGENGTKVPPLEYLQAAEHYSRMYLMDRWTLEQLIKWMSAHSDEVVKIDRFMIKLSGYSMNDDSLLAYIFNQSREHDIPVDKFCFELNETSAIQNIEDAVDFMHEMRSLGCQFTLSDFGNGQSSFEYLKRLPVNYVKIDHTLVKDLVTSSADYAMVKSIHEIAHFMAKKTIAEHVNDADTLNILRSIGIDLAMGGELIKAIPLDQLAELN
ncbi:MAG: diguanylate cyclase (GGDEF)-like protein [Oleispira sp.]|jgi:diguanylate cyclase (GGDEF)-like protein